jgi:hypothetical protein
MDLAGELADVVSAIELPPPGAAGSAKKNYTERLSGRFTEIIQRRLQDLGLPRARAPRGRDKQFMGGYGTKGVDVYLSDEKHGLLLSSGTKGIVYDIPKNLKNRYRDMVMEALELHKRSPFAVCGHLLFLGRAESARPSRAFGTVLGEAVALLRSISGRERPDEASEVYETMGVLLLDPGRPDSIDLEPAGVPAELNALSYCERLVAAFHTRNPFFPK